MVVPGDPGMIVHAQLAFGNGMIMLSSARDTEFDKLIKRFVCRDELPKDLLVHILGDRFLGQRGGP